MTRKNYMNMVTSYENQQQLTIETSFPDLNPLSPQLYSTIFFSKPIYFFGINGEKWLWLPDVALKVLFKYNYLDVLTACEQFKISILKCSPAQLQSLKLRSLVKRDVCDSSLINESDAKVLCTFLIQKVRSFRDLPFEVKVYHNCFGRCDGLFLLQFHLSVNSPCIKCQQCFRLMSPREFILHFHHSGRGRPLNCKPNFNPAKWWRYIHLSKEMRSKFLARRMLSELKYKYLDILPDFQASSDDLQSLSDDAQLHSPSTDDSTSDHMIM